MNDQFRALPYQTISITAKVNRRNKNRPAYVALTDPATLVMTDISKIAPFSIEPTATIDAVNDKMIACGVRLLFVTEGNGDLLGLVTSTDILGEKPVQFITKHGVRREEILVRDIMTLKENLDVLYMSSVANAAVGDIVETMKTVKRQHMLVVEHTSGKETLCGIFSTTQINRQLNINIEPSEVPGTSFADLGKVLTNA